MRALEISRENFPTITVWYLSAILVLASAFYASMVASARGEPGDVAAATSRLAQQASPSGPVVLRGSPAARSIPTQSAPPQAFGSSSGRPIWIAPATLPGAYDPTLDRSGLSPPGGFLYPYQ